MDMVTVTHKASGRTWSVPAYAGKPSNTRRVGLKIRQAGGFNSIGYLDCAGCGKVVSATGGATIDYNGFTLCIESGEADRIVNDHPAFSVTGKVAYLESTVANCCTSCNGSAGRKDSNVSARLETIALALLAEFA